jgi:hypothetical protein
MTLEFVFATCQTFIHSKGVNGACVNGGYLDSIITSTSKVTSVSQSHVKKTITHVKKCDWEV